MEGEAVSGAQLIAQALRAQVRARSGDRQPARRDNLQRVNVRGRFTPTGAAALPGPDGKGSPRRFVGGRERKESSAAQPRERPCPGTAVSCWPRCGIPQADTNSLPLESLPRSRAQANPQLPPSSAEVPLRLSPWQLDVPPAPPYSEESSVLSLNSRCCSPGTGLGKRLVKRRKEVQL